MRILLLAAASSIHAVRWANAFAERGYEVHFASQHPATAVLHGKVRYHALPHRKGAGYLLNGHKVARLVARLRPDVVNAHYASGYGTLARAVKGVPVVLNVWGSDVFEFPDTSPLHKWLLRRNLAHAQCLVSTSEFMARRTRELTGGRQVEVVPFGVDTGLFKPREKGRSGAMVVGTVKTLAHKYGIDTLIKAFARVYQASGGKIRGRITGGGALRPQLEALTADLGVSAAVEFVGTVPHDQVPEELRTLDIYVALSRMDSETFGVAVIEASACGVPVVVSDAGGLPEVVVDGGTGIVVRRDDPEHAAEALQHLIDDPGTRERMGRQGREHVLRNFEWSRCVDRMVRILEAATLAKSRTMVCAYAVAFLHAALLCMP